MRPPTILCSAALAVLAACWVAGGAVGQDAPDGDPLPEHDIPAGRAGDLRRIEWVRPWEEALAQARRRQRLLLVQPVLGGTTAPDPDGRPLGGARDLDGAWEPFTEVLRCGPYADEICIELIERRFVPFVYDARPPAGEGDGFLYDAAAVADIGAFPDGREDLAVESGAIRAPNYPVALIVTPDGEVVDDSLRGVPTPSELVAHLRAALAAHPEYDRPTAREAEILQRAHAHPDDASAQLAAARLRFQLADFDECLEHAEAGQGAGPATAVVRAETAYLRGRVAACRGEVEDALALLQEAGTLLGDQDHGLRDDIVIAQARALVRMGLESKALAVCEAVIAGRPRGDRVGEARHLAGLCLWRLGQEDRAQDHWRTHRRDLPHDRLARRSAACLGMPEAQSLPHPELLAPEDWW